MSFPIEMENDAETARAIQCGLEMYNSKTAGFEIELVPLNLAVRDEHGKLCGGLVARTYTDTLYFDTVWLDESLRGKAQGQAMMIQAEEIARSRGASNSWLVTLSWQARGFYEKLGYRVFGEMPIMSGKYIRYFMQKEL
jgi:ribosomal protein S18 acetylase RimI-like enzyme